MELFVLGLVFGVGAAKRKAVTKAVAKSYMAVTEKTKTVADTLREDMRDAVAEARFQEDQNAADLDQAPGIHEGEFHEEWIALHEETAAAPAVAGSDSAAAEPIAEAKPRGSLLKSLAKSYVAVSEKTRHAAAGLREEMRDAIEEARYEREQAALRAQQVTTEPEISVDAVAVETAEEETVVATAAPVKPVEEPRVKRKYTRATPSEAPASTAQTKQAAKAPAQSAKGIPGPKPGRRKAAPEESRNQATIEEGLLEVAEVVAEIAL
jgi:hypothetical protein